MQTGFSPSAYTWRTMGFTCAFSRFLVLEFDYNYFSPNFWEYELA